MKKRNRILAILLTAIMTFSMLPSEAFATEAIDTGETAAAAVEEAITSVGEEQDVETTVEEISTVEEAAEEIADPAEAEEVVTEETVTEEAVTEEAAEPAADQEDEDASEEAAEPVEAEEIAEPAVEPEVEAVETVEWPITLEAKGGDYTVTATFDESAGFPADVKLNVSEISKGSDAYQSYYDQAFEAVQNKTDKEVELTDARFFDITFSTEAGEVEPIGPVNVSIKYRKAIEAESSDDVHVLHFDDNDNAAPQIMDIETDGRGDKVDEVSFATEGFSVYAVIGTGGTDNEARATVNFIGANGDTIATVYVKNSDTLEELKKIVYDPGAGTLDEGYAFYGWTSDEDYTADTTGMTIADVREELEGLDITEGDVVNFYAIILTHYMVEYLDSTGTVSVGSGSALVRNAGEEEATYKVNMGYPTDDTHNFEGWQVTKGLEKITDPDDITADTIIENETEIKITGNITLNAVAPEGHWLVFDENGSGATYNAPKFFENGELTTSDGLIPMVRKGYTFGGWYTEAACENEYNFGEDLQDKRIIYAKWTPISNADYTILIWKQNLNADGYDFDDSISLNGTVGNTVNTVAQQGTGDSAYARINGTDYQYTGFHLDRFDQNVVISPEGNTVVNVYYNRTSYTLTFRRYQNSGTVYKTITALYGQPIGDNFPISVNGDTTYRWEPHNSSTFRNVLVFIDIMPAENLTFSRSSSTAGTKYMEFYVEALPDQTEDRTWDGKRFVKFGSTIPAKYNWFTRAEDFLALNGYNQYGSDPEFGSDGRAYVNDGETIYFYYTRKEFTLNFLDGAYYDGNGNRIITESRLPQLDKVENIAYQADLTSYNKDGADYKTPTGKDGYIFEGWYIDDACTQAYTFSTMPEGGLTVYAKWRQIQYRVFLHPNAGDIDHEDQSLDWGSDTQQMNFRVSYGGEISTPEGKRSAYEFYGWYLDDGLQVLYPDSFKLHEDNVTYGEYFSKYDKGADFTDVMDKWGNGATTNADTERFWITKKLDLYARWSQITVGADGINVVYDAGDGTNAPTDRLTYKDNSNAAAGAASTPNDEKKVFKHWVVQTWNGSDYVNTEPLVTVLPGAAFTVLVGDAKIEDENGAVVPLADVTDGHKYTYTVKLRAEYADAEEATPTHIPWYWNDGRKAFHIDTISDGQTIADSTLEINKEVKIQGNPIPDRQGYKFLGWAKVNMGNNAESVATWETTPSNWTQKLTANDLFLFYNSTDSSFYKEREFTNKVEYVAADEKTPYEAMFAVWEEIPGYYIYHSASEELKFYAFTDQDQPTDLTTIVTTGYLYGGYYKSDLESKKKGDPITWSGMRFDEYEKKNGDVYYLKEVPDTYLRPQVYLIYNKTHQRLIQGLYGFVNVDSNADYSDCGLIVNGYDEGREVDSKLVDGDIVVTRGGEEYTTLNKSNLFKMGSVECYIGYKELTSYVDFGNEVQITGYYVTKDGIKVTGYKDRMIVFDTVDYGYDDPIFTGWNSNGNTQTGLMAVDSICTETTRSTGNRMAVTRMLMISAPLDNIEYRITKVYDSNTEEQIVEAGDYTGQITYESKDGYMFAGWYQDEAYTVPADFSDINGDMTVYAKYVSDNDIKIAYSHKSKKYDTTSFTVTISVKNKDQLENVTVNVNDDISAVLADKTVKQTGRGNNIKYTTQYKGKVAIKGLSAGDTFTTSVSWTTPDGTLVTGTNRNCTYILGIVAVQ